MSEIDTISVRRQIQDGAMSSGAIDAAMFDEWFARVQADAWSAGHTAALHNLRWPRERRSNPYVTERGSSET